MANTTVTQAVAQDDLVIPVIDFAPFLTNSPTDKLSTAKAVLTAFQTSGFIYLRNHGIPSPLVASTFAHSASFFARPQSEKDALAWYSALANRGYVARGREKLTTLEETGSEATLRASVPDLKESLEIGRDDQAHVGMPNMWPHDDAFKAQMLAFFDKCKGLHGQVMRAIALGMGLDETWFDGYTGAGDNTLRLLHYPGVSKDMFKRGDGQEQVRAGEHSDYGSITLLFQDSRGGLQVRSPHGTFVNATPIADTIVINAGDLLARWSNDTIKSTKHRVVEPPPSPEHEGMDVYPPRYSIAYFCNPNYDRTISAIPGTFDGGKKYEDVNSGEYIAARLTATY